MIGEHPTPGGMHDVEAATTGAVAPEIATPQTPSPAATAAARAATAPRRDPQPFESAGFVTRTAMCAEPRDGRLYVFMPPTATLEDYLELVGAVEDTARRCGCRSSSKATSRRAIRACRCCG